MRASSVVVVVAIACQLAGAVSSAAETMEPLGELVPVELADMSHGLQRNLVNLLNMPEEQLARLSGRSKRGSNDVSAESDELLIVKTMRELMQRPIKVFKEMMDSVKSSELVAGMQKFLLKSIESAIRPMAKMLKKLEDFIGPDGCTLRTVCTAGSNIDTVRDYLEYIPLSAFDESLMFRALTKGIKGAMCEDAFVCVPKKDKN